MENIQHIQMSVEPSYMCIVSVIQFLARQHWYPSGSVLPFCEKCYGCTSRVNVSLLTVTVNFQCKTYIYILVNSEVLLLLIITFNFYHFIK